MTTKNNEEAPSRYTRISITVTRQMLQALRDVVVARGMMSISELFRSVFSDYFENDFRKNFLGYQAGIAPAAARVDRKAKQQSIDDRLKIIDTGTNADIDAFLQECGYIDSRIDPPDREHYTERMVNRPSGKRLWCIVYHNGSSIAEMMSLQELKEDVARFLKAKK